MLRVGSLFSQLLREVPREDFVGLVQKHRAERYAKGFSCWTQLVAMLFAQLARADSLRAERGSSGTRVRSVKM